MGQEQSSTSGGAAAPGGDGQSPIDVLLLDKAEYKTDSRIDTVVQNLFSSASPGDRKQIMMSLSQLGVDTCSDLRYVTEADLIGKAQLKVVHVRKLMEIIDALNSSVSSAQVTSSPKLTTPTLKPSFSSPTSTPTLPCDTASCESSSFNNDKTPPASCDADHEQTTKNLKIATGVLGGVTAAALPLAIFAAVFPPITLPIAVVAGIGVGVVGAATAATGVATAVMVHKEKQGSRPVSSEAERDGEEIDRTRGEGGVGEEAREDGDEKFRKEEEEGEEDRETKECLEFLRDSTDIDVSLQNLL